jgi:hypothetical protein
MHPLAGEGGDPLLRPLLGPVAIALEPEGAELLGAVGAKAGVHGIEVAALLLARQLHKGSEGSVWIDAVTSAGNSAKGF